MKLDSESQMVDKQKFIKPEVGNLHSQDMQQIRLTYITHFYFDQKSPDTLLDLLHKYESYSSSLLDQMHFVIVDDCSPLEFEIPEFKLNLTWLRITDDIRWNQGGARNLGATYAKSDKILLSDLDLEFPEHTLQRMVDARNPGKHFYKIYRKDRETSAIRKGHPNTFFMSRGRFIRLYGYDEEFSGGYGAEDYRFVKFFKYHGSWQHHLPKRFYCHKRTEINRDGAYHSLKRDFSRNTPIDQRKRSELLEWGAEGGHSRMFLNFRWELKRQFWRAKDVPKPRKRYWKHLWLFRTVFGSYD